MPTDQSLNSATLSASYNSLSKPDHREYDWFDNDGSWVGLGDRDGWGLLLPGRELAPLEASGSREWWTGAADLVVRDVPPKYTSTTVTMAAAATTAARRKNRRESSVLGLCSNYIEKKGRRKCTAILYDYVCSAELNGESWKTLIEIFWGNIRNGTDFFAYVKDCNVWDKK